MQALRPWSAKSSERKGAMAVAVLCFIILIALPFWPEKIDAPIEKKQVDIAAKSKVIVSTHTQKKPAEKVLVKAVKTHTKQAVKKVITPTATTHAAPLQKAHKKVTHASSAYFIQVGAFQSKKHAQKLQKKLTKRYGTVIIQKKKNLYAVQVGPYKNKAKAGHIKKQLSHKEKINGFITQHAYP